MQNIICIGRQYGSGGREIGEKLSRVLGIPCYDKLLIKKALAKTHAQLWVLSLRSTTTCAYFMPELAPSTAINAASQ